MSVSQPEVIDGIPNIVLSEESKKAIEESRDKQTYLPQSKVAFDSIKSACAIALHMQQPLIPAGGSDLRTAELISNLKYMMDNQGIGDNHNAPVFAWCYKRIGEFIPQLLNEGKEPRAMLEYSGELLYGLSKMGQNDVIDTLKTITTDPDMYHAVEWLGCPWGHAVAPSTPVQDYRLNVEAWQQYFASVFGTEALQRVKGFSPSEMALPNHPDTAYEFVKTLVDCGYKWVLIQEHTVELPSGDGLQQRHIPHRLVCKNSSGKEASIIAIIKTQGSDTKLVAQMQPYYEAKSLSRWDFAGKQIPPLVTQIADGENGGVMMNEFPPKYQEVVREASHSETPLMNATEYLEHLFAIGITEKDFPVVQPIQQKRIWDRFTDASGPEKLNKVIEEIKKEDDRFHMEGGSWTNDISWVQGYQDVMDPIDKLSSLFSEKVLSKNISPNDHNYRNALYHLLVSQTSCYRYWGQGVWTDYAKEICRRGMEIIENNF
ncbi:glycoside hydrolase family 57 [Chitinispirillum alkaliphilum]|nr:glycoside hydrolase family 57 [Chitinispirillum alkaliphilum]